MKNHINLCLYFLLVLQTIQSQNTNIPSFTKENGFAQLDFLSIKMPNDTEANMDFVGIHYNSKLNSWSYAGLGFYGAVGGIRGGFFTLGINAGIHKEIIKNIFIDTGFHFGGGGGANAPDGGGAFILPHINLGYNFKHFKLATGYSYINFFDKGKIENDQFYTSIQIPLSLFNYSNFKNRETTFDIESLKNSKWNSNSKRISGLIHLNNLKAQGDSQFISTGENIAGRTIRLAGFEFNGFLNKNWFYFVRADGAFSGIPAGYMDIFFGAGYHFSMNKNRTNIQTKFGLGAGGGGGVDTKGGFLIHPDISIEQKLFNTLYLSLNKGYIMSPDAHFLTSTYGIGLKYYLEKDGVLNNTQSFSSVKFKGLETIIKQDWYIDANRNGGYQQDMHQISLQINVFLNKNIYGIGQTSFASFGDAGAYAEGIVGIGIQSNYFLKDKISVYTQILGGAAGGGGISTGEGLIIKPNIGLNLKLTNYISLRSGLGYVKAKGGLLSSKVINFGLNYNLSFLSAK